MMYSVALLELSSDAAALLIGTSGYCQVIKEAK
jgi:hypothetical protein